MYEEWTVNLTTHTLPTSSFSSQVNKSIFLPKSHEHQQHRVNPYPHSSETWSNCSWKPEIKWATVLTALQKKPQPGQHWCFTMPLRWSSHRTSSCTELEGRIISCFRTAIWQRVSCPSTLSVAMHFLSARIRISRLLGVSMRQLQSGSSWASSMADIEVSAERQRPNYLPLYQFKFVSVKLSEGLNAANDRLAVMSLSH